MNLFSPHWRFYWNDRMGGEVLLKDRVTELSPSHFHLIPPNTPCKGRLKNPVMHFYIHFLAGLPYDLIEPEIFCFPMDPLLSSVIHELAGKLKAGQKPHLLHFACRTLIDYGLSRIPEAKVPKFCMDPRVQSAIRLMEHQVRAPLGNSHIAKRVGMSTHAFIRLFKSVTGKTPQAYFMNKRVERACLLSTDLSQSIDEIARQTGFCDRYHFSRVFKKLRGVGPAEYRKRALKEMAGGHA